ncbi:MAG TPA: dihydrolipoamide acetyltransferase family protein [Anaerolineales bacterium]|nr:dihydrolipoamide acetyltransferase family protein [Anaerolineales bacterium]
MAETISMPKLGFDMSEGVLVRWVKNEGENINKGDVLAEIETDKATVEVESSASGVVRKLLANQGDVVPVGTPIAIVGTADEKIEEPKAAEQQSEAKAEQKPPAPSETELPKEEEKPAPAAQKEPAKPAAPEAAPAKPAAAEPSDGRIKASPLARRLAEEKSLELGSIQGSGPGGRIVRKDIEAALEKGVPAAKPSAPAAMPVPSMVPVAREDETVQLSKLRQAIARRMTESKTSAPHFYVTHEYKMDTLMAMRKQVNEYLPENEKISVNDFIIKAVALALREFPNLNAAFSGDKVVRYGAVNIGNAVAVEGGLLTVVNRNADQQPLRAISAEMKRMAAGVREGKVRPADIEGSTFSISNMGMFDVENFFAIINPPEAGILAVGSARQVPVVENGEIKIGWRMKATISVDHRVSDGAEAAQFMQALAKYLEEPLRLLV